MILSGRKSFSEYLFKSIGLPVLPNYSDIQYRHKYRWGKHEVTLIGIGAIDHSRLNITDDPSESLLYNTGYIPEGDQNIFVGGINYKHYLDSGYYHFIVSTGVKTKIQLLFHGILKLILSFIKTQKISN